MLKEKVKNKRLNIKGTNKGITLIALVITIIVILILAGVSINTLFGDNGLLTKAQEAADANTRAGAYDKVATEVFASYDNDGTLNEDTLRTNLKRIGGTTEDGKDLEDEEQEGFPITIKMDGSTFLINGEGNTISTDEIKIGNAINAENYGNEVKTKNSKTELSNGTWRLFYQDGNYTYIIHDELVSLNGSLEDKYGDNYNSGTVGAIGQALNPMIKAQKPDMFTLSDGLQNMKGVAYLTDPDKWKEYSSGLNGALYAIGGPTIELFRASFNAAIKTHEEMNDATEISEFTIGDTGYSEEEVMIGNDFFKTDYSKGIYRKGDEDVGWWLASPRGYYNDFALWIVSEYQGILSECEENWVAGFVRPLVCFQTSEFNSLYSCDSE